MGQQSVKNQIQRLPILVLFTIRKNHFVDLRIPNTQSLLELLQIKRGNNVIGHNQRSGSFGKRLPSAAQLHNFFSNHNRVAAFTQINLHRRHT